MELTLMSTYLLKKLRPNSSIFIRPYASKVQIEVEDYKISPNFEINTYGVSGTIKLRKKKGKTTEASNFNALNLMDPSLDAKNQNILEIGTYINVCPHPYTKTKLIKFLPRYIIINKLDIPLVIKEKNSQH